ncbi:MAG: hypothetical protein RJA81_456 [Planctomycetota bacterium]
MKPFVSVISRTDDAIESANQSGKFVCHKNTLSHHPSQLNRFEAVAEGFERITKKR